MSTIKETVALHVPSGYEGYAANAVLALEAREAQISDELVRYAQGQGADPATIEDLLEGLGMTLPVKVAPAPETTDREGGSGLGERLSRVEGQVARLVALAERHLGSSV